MKVIWLRPAGDILEEIHDFLAVLNPRAAARLYNDLLDEAEALALFPQMAPHEPLLIADTRQFRSLVVRRYYKIVYYIENNTVNIADIWDCRQDPSALEKRTIDKTGTI